MTKTMTKIPRFTPKQVRALRDSVNLTQTEAAHRVGRSRITWARWEMAANAPNAKPADGGLMLLFISLTGAKLPAKKPRKKQALAA
jgi:DNA-binding transcriptional regulator YiaG